jgi:hypothetical protein
MTHQRKPEDKSAALAELEEWVDRAMPDHLGQDEPDPTCPTCGAERELVRRPSGRWLVIDCQPCKARAAADRMTAWRLEALNVWRKHCRVDVADVHWHRQGVELLSCLFDLLAGSSRERCGAYLYGPAGTGKSQQAAELVRGFLAARLERYTAFDAERFEWAAPPLPSVVRVSEPGMLRSLRPNGGAELETYTSAELLIIDDLGVAKSTEWAAEKLWEVLDARWGRGLRTVITSNVTPKALMGDSSNAYDERILRRIFDMCGGYMGRQDGTLAWVHMRHSYSFEGVR